MQKFKPLRIIKIMENISPEIYKLDAKIKEQQLDTKIKFWSKCSKYEFLKLQWFINLHRLKYFPL